ncbi:MAG: serine protease [Burkholderiaceae bacterium]|nr:serine protease [Burkholderiaceae bacterium]
MTSTLGLHRCAGGSLGLLLAALASASSLPALPERGRFAGLSASVLKVEARRLQGGFSLGSAVVVAPQQVVTNCHVVQEAEGVQVLRNGARWEARLEAAEPSQDLCLLRVPQLQGEPVALRPAGELAAGEPLASLGYTGGAGLQLSAGHLHSWHRHDAARVLQVTNGFTSGASGGGLFDAQGRLVGVLTFRLRGAAQHYFAAPSDWVAALLARAPAAVAWPAAAELPYWRRQGASQPDFLQAGELAQRSDWAALQALALPWSSRSPDDPDPWAWLARAALGQADADRALAAARRALALESHWLPALQVQAQAELQLGRIDAARRTQAQMQGRFPQEALDLSERIAASTCGKPVRSSSPPAPGAPTRLALCGATLPVPP